MTGWTFELADGRQIGCLGDEFPAELLWLDHARLKVAKEVKPSPSANWCGE
jgi:hypothetical protein